MRSPSQSARKPARGATAVFGGMLFASVLGIFFVPMLYVAFQWRRERVSRGRQADAPGSAEDAPAE